MNAHKYHAQLHVYHPTTQDRDARRDVVAVDQSEHWILENRIQSWSCASTSFVPGTVERCHACESMRGVPLLADALCHGSRVGARASFEDARLLFGRVDRSLWTGMSRRVERGIRSGYSFCLSLVLGSS